MDKWMTVLAMQMWSLPFLALYILGLVMALNRRDIGPASKYAALGFGLMALGVLTSSVSSYLMFSMREEGNFQLSRIAMVTTAFTFTRTLVNLAGWGLILAAIFAKRPPPPSRVE
jgi:hypothetical protein